MSIFQKMSSNQSSFSPHNISGELEDFPQDDFELLSQSLSDSDLEYKPTDSQEEASSSNNSGTTHTQVCLCFMDTPLLCSFVCPSISLDFLLLSKLVQACFLLRLLTLGAILNRSH